MKNGIIIVNYNDYLNTYKLINNIKNYKVLDIIIVVDNKSTDNSLNELKKLEVNNLVILESSENKGYSYALNIGCKYLINKYKKCNIIISNTDIEISKEEDIKELIGSLNNDIVVVGPIIDENGIQNKGWKIPNPKQDIIMNIPFIWKKYKNKYIINKACYCGLIDVEAVSGCFFAITSNHLKEINYFDENVFLYYEENIIGIKTKNLNKRIVVNGNIVVKHNHSVTIDNNISKKTKYRILKNSQYYFQKNYNNASKFELFLLKFTTSR